MTPFRSFFPILAVVIAISAASAQRVEDVLASSTGITYKASSLSPRGQKFYFEQRKMMTAARTDLLNEMIAKDVLELESKLQNVPGDKLLETQRAKAAEPTATEIQATYNANQSLLGGVPINEVRKDIVEFLKHDAEQKQVETYILALRTKHKVAIGKDLNAFGLAPTDVVVTIADRPITLAAFDEVNKIRLNDTEVEIYDEIRSDLESAIFSTLVTEEAKARSVDSSGLIAVEITDKLRDFSDEERAALESDLMHKLFAKYSVKISLAEPKRIVHNVSVDDDPSTGKPDAPVTVVMFTDFQCPACSRTHPVLKKALSVYGDKIRFVVRDYPLEKIHENSFNAALAANAARAQGKFAEYTEILYRNQQALDKASLTRYATELGLNVKQFELDFSDAKTAAEVRKDQADGKSYGIAGTPAIFVNGVKVQRLSLMGFRSAVDRALAK
jgi:protein-disulfide isomerase